MARVTQAQLGAAGILGNFAANLGAGFASQAEIHINLRDVQELGLDAWRVNALYDFSGPQMYYNRVLPQNLLMWLSELRSDLVRPACAGDVGYLGRSQVALYAVNRVLYSGGIEFSFSSNAQRAIRAVVDLQGALPRDIRRAPEVPPLTAQNQGGGQQPQSNPNARGTRADEPGANAESQRVNALMSSVTGVSNSRAGVHASLGIGTFGQLALIENFNRPVAVGAGSRFRIDFHEALRGTLPDRATDEDRAKWDEYRFLLADRFCRNEFDANYGRDALWRAMTKQEPDPERHRPPATGKLEELSRTFATYDFDGRLSAAAAANSSRRITRSIAR
ncbi:hypothetical protein E2C06_09705 [Dankookia rubra]|uniref:Uncharacterized protein n=1 Tax=Dankookia rubra TaxID=1442381 RepID=A0A4R5QHV0_9PROT|nr:hypothetical protein [Dankookia rubra]TDH62944.1 hypothetical protein E2C06_09705 [Dankookia rubra]